MKTLAYLAWCACALAFGQQNKTPAAAVSGLSPADVAAIRAASKSYTDLGLARDWPKWIKLFTGDAVYLPPHETARHGPREIEAWAATFPVLKTLVIEPLEFTGGGALAVVRGRYSLTMASQPDVPDTGKYIEVWRKQSDGAWKLFRDIWNSDLPLPEATAASATPASEGLLTGSWELNVVKSRFSPGPGPRSETRTYSITADGRQHAIYDNVDAEGRRVRSESTFTLDGKDSPITGDLDEDTQAITRTGPRTLSAQIKKGGKVLRTATREISEDGKMLTLHFRGVNAKGRPLDDTWVFDRKTDLTPKSAGTYQLVSRKLPSGDHIAVAASMEKYLTKLRTNNADAVASWWTTDAIYMPRSIRTFRGSADLNSFLKEAYGSIRVDYHSLDADDILVSGDLAVVAGTFNETLHPKTGASSALRGRFVLVWQRQHDGAWKILRGIGTDWPEEK